MRLFVAVVIPADIRERMAELGKEIKQEGVVTVKPEKMHLTLKFIGDGNPDEITGKLKAVKFKKFICRAGGTGAFPDEKHIKVVWAGVSGLEELAEKVQEALGKKERFAGHATIARVKRRADLKAFLEKHRKDEFGEFWVSEFELIKSELGPEGPAYTTIARFGAEK
ncbi:RNA 2',3'-cyclic phosphodiesterase [Candidatus Micrarchaeota archaeon]|nr:RNA 2',3'-cyclic phosphodiesterase [Candidatus Micrarchaeota archaeon]